MLVETLISNILIDEQLLFTMYTITEQIHNVAVLHTHQHLRLIHELFLTLARALRKLLHRNLSSIIQLPLHVQKPNNYIRTQI